MSSGQVGDGIAKRLLKFAVGVVRLLDALSGKSGISHVSRQLVRAATAGGSNYEEARGAESRSDFIHKLGVARKELREAWYWLRLANELHPTATAPPLIQEADELIAILTASMKTAKKNRQ